jgi:uncharacterized protein (DUF302 family)
LIIGNPTIAITMLRHDLTAGLFVPVELILVEEHDGRCSLHAIIAKTLLRKESGVERSFGTCSLGLRRPGALEFISNP